MKLIVRFPAGAPPEKVTAGITALATAATGDGLDAAVEVEAGLPGYMNIARASEWSGIPAPTLRKWLCEGKLTRYKVGKIWLIKETDLKAFIDKHKLRAAKINLAPSPFEEGDK